MTRQCVAVWALACAVILSSVGTVVVAAEPTVDPRLQAAAQLEEAQAYHIGTLGYLYGFPMVDMMQNMYRETRPGSRTSTVLAPVNRFFRFRDLVTPETAGTLRAPNSDTLYLNGWFDLRDEPIVIRAPDTRGRYYTLAVTDFHSEVQHVGRRTTGTAARDFVLTGPAYTGLLPAGLHAVRVPTHQAWVLGRILVNGAEDLPAARAVLDGFEAVPLSQWLKGARRLPDVPPAESAEDWRPTESLEFFAVLNWWLRDNPRQPAEAALLSQFDAVGFGPSVTFDAATISEATRRGLQRGLDDARAMLRAASRRPLTDVRNGWIFPLNLGRYGHDYLMRATVAFGGYANLPEETIYAALTADTQGQPLRGDRDYVLRFAPGEEPPVGAFWSISAYRSADFSFMPNTAARYSIGPHVPGFRRSKDGSIVIRVSRQPPVDERENWLPVGAGPYYLILRLYEPGAAILDGHYAPPAIE